MLIHAYITADDHVRALQHRVLRLKIDKTVRALALVVAAGAFVWAALPGCLAFAASIERMALVEGFNVLIDPAIMGPALLGTLLLAVAAKALYEMIASLGRAPAAVRATAEEMAAFAADGITGAHDFAISPRGLRVATDHGSRWFDWSLVSGCIDAGASLKICVGRSHWILLPKSAMPQPDQPADVLAAINRFAGSSTRARPPRRQHLRPTADDIVVLTGRITCADLADRITWQRLEALPPGWRNLQALYMTPAGLFAAILLSSTVGVIGLASVRPHVWAELVQERTIALSDLLFVSLSLLLLAGAAASLVQFTRRVLGVPLGLAIGPRDYAWGSCDISLTETGVARATARHEETHHWAAFSRLAETDRLFLLASSPGKCFIVPKRLFPDEDSRQAFRALAAEKLARR